METPEQTHIIPPNQTGRILHIGQVVFFSKSEEYWDLPIVMKRHHVYKVKTVVLRGEVTDAKENQFSAKLFGNNGFERDGEEYVFNKGSLLSEQDYKDLENLGKWNYEKTNEKILGIA